ncbi:MAG: hydroxyacylglutathione hydrolase [Pseudohongiella sp.]|nr:hydroxyacylglutathione hydrolase [Pseudohongiella sp.]
MINHTDSSLRISPIPAFRDNYIWAIENSDGEVVLVDPGDAAPVENFLADSNRSLQAILITHHHADHTGGITQLCKDRKIPVYGPVGNHIKGITHPVKEADIVTLLGAQFEVLAVPGHTLDHLAYFLTIAADHHVTTAPALFCGDTLFAGGCGRLFEGTAEMMYTSLLRIGALPEQTRIYCAHEYTVSNLGFATKAEPDNKAVELRYALELRKREQAIPTLPSTIFDELRTNPFLRCHSVSLKKQVTMHMAQELHSDLETFMYLRRWKDQA